MTAVSSITFLKRLAFRSLPGWFFSLLLFTLFASGLTAAEAKMEKAKPVSNKPEIASLEPRGIQRGITTKIKLTGTNLAELIEVKFPANKFLVELLTEPAAKTNMAWISVTATNTLTRGDYEFFVVNKSGESKRVKLYVDDIPQLSESSAKIAGAAYELNVLPVAFWGTIAQAGEIDQFHFEAKAGQTMLFDLAVKKLGSRMTNGVLTILEPGGHVLARTSGNEPDGNPVLAYQFKKSGKYVLQVNDMMFIGSKDHSYRLSMGSFPYVTGYYPLSVPANQETAVELIGYNLPAKPTVFVKALKAGEMMLPLDAEKFRSPRPFQIQVSDWPELLEQEPNDTPQQATKIPVPGSVNGRIWPSHKGLSADVDLYQFDAKKGQHLIIETMAAKLGSPIDTKLEVLHKDGTPVQQVLLQAVRDSQINFRGIDSTGLEVRVDNWQEMDLNQYVYLQGEVGKIFRMPRGPDSGLTFYSSNGRRLTYFNTSSTTHALDEPCYIVEPLPPGAPPIPNGLPTFPINYVNEDDPERELGTDSRIHFTAPEDGTFLVRVTDTRNFSGELYVYRLIVREAKPDFKITLTGGNPTISPGASQGFSLKADRIDGFDGAISMSIANLPPGFEASSPIVIEAGHLEADGSLHAALDAPAPTMENGNKIKITATAMINGQTVSHEVNDFGAIKLGEPSKLLISLVPGDSSGKPILSTNLNSFPEITIAPGQAVPAWLMLVRNGDTNLVNLDIDNLPHGVIVDNIGLNGVQIRAGENEREIFLTAAKWVPEGDRFCHAVLNSARANSNSAGRQTSIPVLIRIRKASSSSVAGANQ